LFAGIGIAVAAVLFVAGALRTAGAARTDHMAAPVGLALGGALLVSLVAAVLVAQLRASVEGRKAAVFGGWLTEGATGCGGTAFMAVDTASPQPVAVADGAVFVAAGQPLYHRAGCQLLADRAVTEGERAGLPAGTTACRLCEPG
jgi:hypothetical protein